MADSQPPGDGQLATIATQVNTILVNQGDMAKDVAVIKVRMEAVPDHENRIRELRAEVPPRLIDRLATLEAARARSVGAAVAAGVLSSGAASLIIWALSRR